ncbi:MAG: RnfABCDGE type electron transport complex subunit D [Acidobacteria bacterium]|jgi:electron transport complex protein RnfD|nr:RnfABCDGE type electron transport complex subunit D [Acidobacteriota bacterium]
MNRLTVSLSPHEKGNFSVEKIMWGVVIALMPSFLASVYFFGFHAIRVVVLGMFFCIAVEYLIQKFIVKKPITAFDGSAAVTGLLLAFNVPSSIPWWQLLIGSIVAIGVAKMTFGGLGQNPFNPALIGRAFMLASFPVQMTTWPVPLVNAWKLGADAVTSATPLGILKEGVKAGQTIPQLTAQLPGYFDMFIGFKGGCVGEVSVLAILIGAIFLLYKKIITWHIPIFYLFSLAAFTGVSWLVSPTKYADPLFHLLAGGAMLGAWFMATDMATSPMTIKGQVIFAVSGGILCGVIRLLGAYPEGCSYSILIMNAFVPLIDKFTKPRRFGEGVKHVR